MNGKILLASLALGFLASAFAEWKPAGDKIKTDWATTLSPDKILPEYPRPQMERARWQNLNGLWSYAITKADSPRPSKYDGEILVPFAIESSLSGVQKPLTKNDNLWYERSFKIPQDWKDNRVLLHFGAVDWKAEVFINDTKVGEHTGGYVPFYFDITSALVDGANKVVVKVWDPTDEAERNPNGKQTMNPHGCHYTAVSGIWQTVWLEPVPQNYISKIKTTPNLDKKTFEVQAFSNADAETFEVKIFDGKNLVAKTSAKSSQKATVEIQNPKLWSPDSPFLYDMEIDLIKGVKIIDSVKSYTAMRKFSIGKDKASGAKCLMLNNENIYHFGPLDQGWWPDGLYTAPTDEALKFDVVKTKEWGFNMIRKHIKIEPARWYMHCDKIGLLVWQDIPCAGHYTSKWKVTNFKDSEVSTSDSDVKDKSGKVLYKKTTQRDIDNFRKELTEIVDTLYSFPCIAVWVPFNEAWGQFDTVNTVNLLKQLDSTRQINPASGGNYFQCGDILDIHNYPAPRIKILSLDYINVMGEYGGIGIKRDGHIWETKKYFGYGATKSDDEAMGLYEKYASMLEDMINYGIVSAVYTQTTDVEIEINGLMTYDRKVMKFDEKKLRQINQKLINSFKK